MITLQLWRNATIQITINGISILVDPMLGSKGAIGKMPWTADQRDNPLSDLPFSCMELEHKLNGIDAVLLTHLHPDHWDDAAIRLIDRQKLIICTAAIEPSLRSQGFSRFLICEDDTKFGKLIFRPTKAKHGLGEIGSLMGHVDGYLISHSSGQVYIAGDTVYCEEVQSVLQSAKPLIVVLNGGAAQFQSGEPVTMTADEISVACKRNPQHTFLVIHLESLSHCTQGRQYLKDTLLRNQVTNCYVPEDGETVSDDTLPQV